MRYSLGQMLVAITWLPGFILAVQTFGLANGVLLGALLAIYLVFAYRLVLRWRFDAATESVFVSIAAFAAVCALSIGVNSLIRAGEHTKHSLTRQANRMVTEIHSDARFAAVAIAYRAGASSLWVEGDVATQEDYDELRALIERHHWQEVMWSVAVRTSSDDPPSGG